MRDESPHVATASLIRANMGERRQPVITCRVTVFINQPRQAEETSGNDEREGTGGLKTESTGGGVVDDGRGTGKGEMREKRVGKYIVI